MTGADGPEPTAEAAAHLHTMARHPDELRRGLEAWLAGQVDDPEVSDLRAPTGTGVSSDTVLFDLTCGRGAERRRIGCVARLEPDPSTSRVFPRYDLPKQARLMRLVAERSRVPVPPVLFEEPTGAALGSPCFVMGRVDGEVPPDIMPYPFGSWLSEADPADQRRLQDAAVGVLAELHRLPADDSVAFLAHPGSSRSALRRHVAHTAAYYRWVASEGIRSPLLERALAWVEDHWPAEEGPAVVSWGDSRIGNMVFSDFTPVAVLDWEMAGLGPRELDLAWMVFLHRFLDDLAVSAGLAGMPGFMAAADVAATYEAGSGHTPRHFGFYGTYAATLMGVVIFREQQRPLLQAGLPFPDDPDSLVLHRGALEEMLAGSYWDRF